MTYVLEPSVTPLVTGGAARVRWHPLTRIVFRFCFVYFGLYVAATQMLGGMIVVPGNWNLPELGTLPPLRNLISWTAFAVFFDSSQKSWTRYGGGAPKPALYGIWNVERMWIDGVERSALVTDFDRWRRVVFQVPTAMTFQRMDDTFAGFGAKVDMDAKTIALTRGTDKTWSATLSVERPENDRLTLAGSMDGRRIRTQLRRVDHTKMLLLSRGFNWIQGYPFNRSPHRWACAPAATGSRSGDRRFAV